MDVILLKKVTGLGALGDKVAVRPGYARNFLLPGGWAAPATAANLAAFEERRAELEREAAAALAAAQARKQQLEGVTVSIGRKAGDEGRLFGSVGIADIAQALADHGIEIDKREIRIANGPFRTVGEYAAQILLHADVGCSVRVEVVAAD